MSGPTSLGALADAQAVAARLQARGLKPDSAESKARLFAQAAKTLLAEGLPQDRPARPLFVPGRIEVLGKHTDYAGGRSVIVAADRGFCLVAATRGDSALRMIDVAWGQRVEFAIDPELSPALGHWSNYPMTAARRLARNFPGPLLGADVAFGSDLPAASGMSSSSAMIVASFLVLAGVNELDKTQTYTANIKSSEDLAEYLGTVENGQSFRALAGDKGVGTFGGSEDHTAILCCRPDAMSQYSYCPLRFERFIPVPAGYVFAIASSGVAAEKTGKAMEKYNRASRLAGAVAEAWRSGTGRSEPHMAAALASSAESVGQLRQILRRWRKSSFDCLELLARLEQFHQESEMIIPEAGRALADGRIDEFGRLVDRSQRAAETLLGNQVTETIFLACSARQIGAAAASSFGAGFGGSVWAMVSSDKAQEFVKAWARRYRSAFPRPAANANFFLTSAGPAAFDI